MSDKEWFSGSALDDPEARAERHELRKVFGILAIVGVLVGLFLGLGGCAAPQEKPTDPYLRMVCAIVATGEATFEGVQRRFPSMKLICEQEPNKED